MDDSLKNRFGREELSETLGLVVKNAASTKGVLSTSQLYDKLESHFRFLESIRMTSGK